MAGRGGVRTRAVAVASAVAGALPPPVSDRLRRARWRLRSADARRVAGDARAGAGQFARSLPGATRVFGTRWSARVAPWSTVTVTGPDGAVVRSLLPGDTDGPERVDGALVVRVPDAPALVRLAASGLLAGTVRSLAVRVDQAPAWLRAGARVTVPDPGTTRPTQLSWRSAGRGVDVTASWERPAGVAAALETALRAVLRSRPWPQAGGPLPVTDRAGWTDGGTTPAQGVPLDARPVAVSTGPGPLRPFTDPAPWDGPHPVWSPVAAASFPHRRKLLGEPARYRLTVDGPSRVTLSGADGRVVTVLDGQASPEAVLSDPGPVRYATVELPEPVAWSGGPVGDPGDGWLRLVTSALATAGQVLVPTGRSGADLLSALGIPFPSSAAEVTGPDGYAWSALVSRTAGVLTESTLRRTGLAVAVGGPPPTGALLPLPTVSVLVASMRPDTLGALLTDLSRQTYPAFEVVLGTHGWTASPAQLDEWSALVGHPLRSVSRSSDVAFGDVLGALTRTADGDVLTKADDDDVYGPDHLTDLVLAWRQTGADLVAKAPRFVHLEDPADPTAGSPAAAMAGSPEGPRGGTTGTTVDRSWAATEVFDFTPAGGTLLAARSTLLDAGGWSGSLRHVDIDLTARIRQAGGVTYRTHGLGYVYVRHARGHTWEVDRSLFLEQAGDVMAGLPEPIWTGRPTRPGTSAPGAAGRRP